MITTMPRNLKTSLDEILNDSHDKTQYEHAKYLC